MMLGADLQMGTSKFACSGFHCHIRTSLVGVSLVAVKMVDSIR